MKYIGCSPEDFADKSAPAGHPFYGNQHVHLSSGTFGGDSKLGSAAVGPTATERAEAEKEYYANHGPMPEWAGGASEDKRQIEILANNKAYARNAEDQRTMEKNLYERTQAAAEEAEWEKASNTFKETPMTPEVIARKNELHDDAENYRKAATAFAPDKKEKIDYIVSRMQVSISRNMHPDVVWMMANFRKIGITVADLIAHRPKAKRARR